MFQRLLICTDLSDGLQRLVHFVPSLAVGGVKQIAFLHIIPISSDQAIPRLDDAKKQQAINRLAVAQSHVPSGVEIKIEVQWGRPVDQILNFAKIYQPDLILLGTQSRSLLTEKLFGSTTVGLCQRTPIPVMILRPQLLSTYRAGELELRCRYLFRYFLIPYNGSRSSDYLIEQIKQQAQDRSPESLQNVLLTWVVDPGGRRDVPKGNLIEPAQARLKTIQAQLEALDLKVVAQVLVGEAVPEILLSAQEYDISAIVLSSNTLGTLAEIPARSFASEMLRRSWYPVIYFPPMRR